MSYAKDVPVDTGRVAEAGLQDQVERTFLGSEAFAGPIGRGGISGRRPAIIAAVRDVQDFSGELIPPATYEQEAAQGVISGATGKQEI